MSTHVAEPTVRPRGWWYLLVVMLWVASVIVFVTAVTTFAQVIDDGVTPLSAENVIPEAPQSGLTIYSSRRPGSGDCRLVSPAATVGLNDLWFDLNAKFDGTTLYAVGTTPAGFTAGPYVVVCPKVPPGSQLYYGDRFPLSSIFLRVAGSAVLGLVGLLVLTVLLVRRHTSKSRIRRQRLAGAPGYGTGWPGQAWPPGPPDGQPGQPSPPYAGQQPPYPAPYPPQPPPQPTPQPPPYDEGNPPS